MRIQALGRAPRLATGGSCHFRNDFRVPRLVAKFRLNRSGGRRLRHQKVLTTELLQPGILGSLG